MIERWHRTNQADLALLMCAREHKIQKNSRYGPVIREIYTIDCCTGGHGSVIINGTEFPVKAGDCYIMLPGDSVIHTSCLDDPRQGIWCTIDGLSVGRYLKEAGITSQTPFAPREAFGEINEWMERLLVCQSKEDPGGVLQQTGCIYGILGALFSGTSSASEDSIVEKAIGYMETQYHLPVQVTQLARHVGLARSYFSTVFKKKTGLSPYQYLSALRIEKACRLLKRSNLSVAQIAESVGLDARNFARLFKQKTRKTPMEYKLEPFIEEELKKDSG